MRAFPAPDVAFNYMGQYAAVPGVESAGEARSARALRRHLIEINGEICGGRLRIHWEYSEHHHRRTTIERWALEFMLRLRDLIDHCRSPNQGGCTVPLCPGRGLAKGISTNSSLLSRSPKADWMKSQSIQRIYATSAASGRHPLPHAIVA